MRFRNYSDEGFVLARRTYGEADRILSIFSKNHGRLSLIAKGVRKVGSRKRGHIEVFSLVKFAAAGGRGLDLITETETIDNYPEVRKSLNKVALAYFFMETIGRTTHENEKNLDLFNLIEHYFDFLKTEKKLKSLRSDFIREELTLLGFWPKGKTLPNPDEKLQEVTERYMGSVRVGKQLVS
jgi:DNA repair protein RecO (recombination protein O)